MDVVVAVVVVAVAAAVVAYELEAPSERSSIPLVVQHFEEKFDSCLVDVGRRDAGCEVADTGSGTPS